MKSKFAVLGLMLIVLLGGVFGLVGCGDKYQNLKLNLIGETVLTDDDGQYYIEMEYDEEDASKNVISFAAVLSGYTEDMRTTMTLSIPQDQATLISKRIRGNVTTFNVQLLTSGVMQFVVYSDETSIVFTTLTVRALLRTQSIADKQANLTLMRPSTGSAEYVLDDEALVDFTPYYSTARDLVYSVSGVQGISIVTEEDGSSKIKVANNAALGIVPVTVRSSRIVLGSEDYDEKLTAEQKEQLTTTIYAFVYDFSWQLGAFDAGNQNVNKISLSNISSQYNLKTKFLSVINDSIQEVELSSVADIYPVFNAVSNNTSILTIDTQGKDEFMLYSGAIGDTKLSLSLDLYYVPNLDPNVTISDFSQYRKVMSYNKDINVSIVRTPTNIQLTNNNGITSTTNISMGIFEQNTTINDENEVVCLYGSDAYVDVNILPLTLAYEYRKITLDVKANYNSEDYTNRAKEVLCVYYYYQNILNVINFDDEETLTIPCGANGVRLYVAFHKEITDVFDKVELKVSTINITDVYDVISSTITCNLKEGVKQIKDIVLTNSVENSIIHSELSAEDVQTNYAYLSLEDKTNGVACSVKYVTNESQGDGITDGNQVFNVSVPETQDIVRVALIENTNRFVLYPLKQGTVLVTVTSENNKVYEFIARVVVGITSFSVDYVMSSGTLGDVTYKTDADNEETAVVKDYGLKTMYLQTDSRIILKNIFNPNSADIIIANQPYTITAKSDDGVSSGVLINSTENMGQRVLTLRALKAGEYVIKCTASAFVKDANGIWQIQPINREFTLYVFNPVNGVIWRINNEEFYGSDDLVYEIYDNDAVSFDKQNIFDVRNLTTYTNGRYYLNPMGFDAFAAMNYPSLNNFQLTDKKLFISFNAIPYCNDRLSPNYINNEYIDDEGNNISEVSTGGRPSLHYSIDYSSTAVENRLASIINIGVGTKEYPSNNSTQAFTDGGIWMGFTSVMDNSAKQYVYEYKISVIIKQANRLTTTSVFTLRIIQPITITHIDTVDEVELEYGGLNAPVVPVSVNAYPNNAYDTRWVYSLDGVPFTMEMLKQTVEGNKPTSVLDNGKICFDPNTMQITLSESYTGGSSDTSITFWAVDSISALRDFDGDKYYAVCQDGSNAYFTASPQNGEALGLYAFDSANNMIFGVLENVVYKTIKIHINAGDTPNSAFEISNAQEFYNFAENIRLGKTYAGQYIKITNNIYNIDLTGLEATNNTFSGVLFADENNPVTLHFVNSPYNLFGNMVNASIQNITFNFENAFDITSTEPAGILAKSIVYQNVNTSSLNDTYYLVNGTYTKTTTSNCAVYRYIINKVYVVLKNHITLTATDFGVFAGQASGAVIVNSEITFANLGNVIKGINASGTDAVGGLIGRTTYSSYINELSTIINIPTILNHCIVRLYNNNAIRADSGYVGGLVGVGESLQIDNSYVFAYNKSYISIYGQGNIATVGGLVGSLSNGGSPIVAHINNSFVNANIGGYTLGVLYGTSENGTQINCAFGNIIANQEISIVDTNVNQTQVYSYVGVYDNVTDDYVYTQTKTDDLDFNNLDSSVWTIIPEFNDSKPLLMYNGARLYENVLPEIDCSINASYVISAYDGEDQVVDGSTKIKVQQGQVYHLSALLDGLDNLAEYDVILMPSQSYASVVITQATYKNIGDASLQFMLPGEYTLMLVSLQNTTINQSFSFLVSANVSMVTLSTESNGEDVELIGNKTVVAHSGDQYRVDILNIPNGLDNIAYVRYIVSSADKEFISFNNQVWAQDLDTGKYFVDIKMSDVNTMYLLGNVTITYQYVLKYTYEYNTNDIAKYEPIKYGISEGDGRFAFIIQIVPNASLDVSNVELYSSDSLTVTLSSNVNSVPDCVFTDEGGISYLKLESSPVEAVNGVYNFRYTVTVQPEYQYLTESATQTIQFKQNDIVVAVLTVYILPTPIASAFATYYFGGTDKLDDTSTQSSHIIIPGGRGVFKLNVDYSYSNYEFLKVYSSSLQNTQIFFTQYYKYQYFNSTQNQWEVEYREVPNGSIYDEDGILTLQKLTGINEEGNEYFDGTYYISTYVPSSIKEDTQNCYYVYFEPKVLENGSYVNAFDQDVAYALYPGFVSTVELKNVKTAVADNAVYLVTQNQKIPFDLEMNLRNTTVNIATQGLTIYKDNEAQGSDFNYATNETTSGKQTKSLYATINAANGLTASITITVTQEGQVVDVRTYSFVVVDKIVPKAINADDNNFGYHINYNAETGLYSDALTIYTNIYTTLNMYHDEYEYINDKNEATVHSIWSEFSILDNFNVWSYQGELLVPGEYTYFKVEEITVGSNKNYRLIGLTQTSGLTLHAQAFIYYTLEEGVYKYNLDTSLSGKTYQYLQTINYEFTVNVTVGSTEEAPLHINNLDDFKKLNGATGGYYILTNDLVLDNWAPFELNVTNLDFNNHRVTLRSMDLTSQKNASADSIVGGLFTIIGENTLVRNLILDISMLVYVDALDKSNIDFGFVAGINNGIIYNVDVVAFDKITLQTKVILNNTSTQASANVEWVNIFDYKCLNNATNSLNLLDNESLDDKLWESTLDSFNYNDDRVVATNTKSIFNSLSTLDATGQITNATPSVFILTGGYTATISTLTTHIGGIAGTNNGFVTNARVGRSGDIELNNGSSLSNGVTTDDTATIHNQQASPFNIYASGFVGGLVGLNTNVISGSYFNGGYVINTATSGASSTKTAGLVAMQNVGARIYGSYAQGKIEEGDTSASDGGVKSQGTVAGLVHTNNGKIDNSLSNIPLYSSAGVGGFVYANNGSISTSISLSHIQSNNSILGGLFVGINSQQTLQNFGEVKNCYYLIQSNIIKHNDEKAYGLEVNGFIPSNLYSFSIADNEEASTEDYVWQIEVNNNNTPQDFDDDYVNVKLISANTITYGVRIIKDGEENLKYASQELAWGGKQNPIILGSAEDWNKYFADYNDIKLTNEQKDQIKNNYGVNESNNSNIYYRLVADINFGDDESYFPQNSYKFKLNKARLQGNGLTINNISYITNANDTQGGDKLGLFGEIDNSIITGVNIVLRDGIIAGNYKIVGALAGKIANSKISNITINGMAGSQLVGYHMVGGLAGQIENTNISNISASVSVSASYIATASEAPQFYTISGFDAKEPVSAISYAGGIAGVINKSDNQSNDQFVAEYLVVDGENIVISAEHAGGVVGLIDKNITLSHSKYVLANPANLNNIQRINGVGFVAGGLVGENRGKIEFSCVDYDENVQKQLDTQALQSNDVNNTLGNLNLFANTNSIAIGGLVGLNYGGEITDSYTRAEVVSKKAIIAGGLIGIATANELTNINTSNVTTLFGNNFENIVGECITNLDRVYTTSFVYAKNCVGGLIGYMIGQAKVNSTTSIIALNKMPQNDTFNYNTVAYKGNTIGLYLSTNDKKVFKTSTTDNENPYAAYSPAQYGIFAINQGGLYNQIVFDNEVGNLIPYSQAYANFVQGYAVSYLETLQNDSIVFNGMAVKSSDWSIDTTKTSHIMPVLRTGNVEYSTTIKNIDEWNSKLQHAYGARTVYTVIDDIETSSVSYQAFDAQDITIEGALQEDEQTHQVTNRVITVFVDDDFEPLFKDAENLIVNNLDFVFDIQTTNALNIASLLCATATNCAFNNVNVTIGTTLTLKQTEVFGALVGRATGKLSIYNCQVNGNIKLSGGFNETRIGAMVGSIAYNTTATTLSSVYSSEFGNIEYTFNETTTKFTVEGESYIGGLIGFVNGQHTIHGTSTGIANFKVKFGGDITADAKLCLGGLIGKVQNATINSITVAVAGSLNITGTSEVFAGNAFGLVGGNAQIYNIISDVYPAESSFSLTTDTAISFGGICGSYEPTDNCVMAYSSVYSNLTFKNTNAANVGVVIGRIVASTSQNAIIVDSVFSMGDVLVDNDSTGDLNLGGLIGQLGGISTKKMSITNCATFSTLKINSTTADAIQRKTGGLVGVVSGENNYEMSNSVAYGLINVDDATTDTHYLAGAIGYSASNVLKLCIIATGITHNSNEKIKTDAIFNSNISNDTSITKVYYVPNMMGEFTKFRNAISINIKDLVNQNKWNTENVARVNPTNFAIKKSTNEETNIYYLAVPTTLLNSIPSDNSRTKLVAKTNLGVLSDVTNTDVNIWLNSNSSITINSTITWGSTVIARCVSDGVELTTNVTLFNQIPQNVIVSGIRLSVPNNSLSTNVSSSFGLLANTNNGVLFDCSLGHIIEEEVVSPDDYSFAKTEENNTDNPNLPQVPYYTAPNYTVIELDIQSDNVYVGGLIGENNGMVNGCYVYADFVFNSTNTSKFGGLIGNNAATLQNSYIIGRQVYDEAMASANLGKAFASNETNNNLACASYVVQYYKDANGNHCNICQSDPNNSGLASIWKQDTRYNYGIYMFSRYYNDEDIQSTYYTGDGASMPYEIIDYAQLFDKVNEDYDFVLVKNIFVTSAFTEHPTVKGRIDGNGHTLFVHSYPIVTDSVNHIDKYSVFGTINSTASIYDLNVHICAGMTLTKSSSATAISFGGLALDCNSSNIKNVAVFTREQSNNSSEEANKIAIDGYTATSYVGGLFSTLKASALSRCYANVRINLTNCTDSNIFMGAFIGRVDRPNTTTRSLAISMCKVDCEIGYIIGKLQTPSGTANNLTLKIDDCYTTAIVFNNVVVEENNGVNSFKYNNVELNTASFRFVQDSGDLYSPANNKNAINIYSSYYKIKDTSNKEYCFAYKYDPSQNNNDKFVIAETGETEGVNAINVALLGSGTTNVNTNWYKYNSTSLTILNYQRVTAQESQQGGEEPNNGD